MAEKKCASCGKLTQRKYMGKIRGEDLCKKCRTERRISRREKTISDAGIKEDLQELSRKAKEEHNKAYRKKQIKKECKSPPLIKGSKLANKKEKSSSYLTYEDKRQLISILIKKGLDFEEAKERIKELVEQLKKTREKMKQKNNSEEKITIKQQKLLEELWEY